MDTTGPRKCVLTREVSLFPEVDLYTIGTSETLLIREASLFQRCPLREVPQYVYMYNDNLCTLPSKVTLGMAVVNSNTSVEISSIISIPPSPEVKLILSRRWEGGREGGREGGPFDSDVFFKIFSFLTPCCWCELHVHCRYAHTHVHSHSLHGVPAHADSLLW